MGEKGGGGRKLVSILVIIPVQQRLNHKGRYEAGEETNSQVSLIKSTIQNPKSSRKRNTRECRRIQQRPHLPTRLSTFRHPRRTLRRSKTPVTLTSALIMMYRFQSGVVGGSGV